MTTARQLLAEKGGEIHTISSQATVYEAIENMVANNVGALVVSDRAHLASGILTERDYLKRVALQGRSSKTTIVAEIMTPGPVLVELDTTTDECMRLVTDRRIRHLPVIGDDLSLVGMLSIGDIVRHLAQKQESEIRELHHYIQGRYG